MAYRPLDYTNDYNKHDIERLLAEKFDTTPEDKNTITDAMLANYKGFVVTWSIDNAAGSEVSN